MIVFYEKKTGNIVGTIEGRIHSEDQMGMWIGDRKKTDRIVCNWQLIKGTQDYEPENQKQVFTELDKNPGNIFKYKVNLKTKTLVLV